MGQVTHLISDQVPRPVQNRSTLPLIYLEALTMRGA